MWLFPRNVNIFFTNLRRNYSKLFTIEYRYQTDDADILNMSLQHHSGQTVQPVNQSCYTVGKLIPLASYPSTYKSLYKVSQVRELFTFELFGAPRS